MSSDTSHLPVLTSLCPICYTNPPKYRCPRCSMRTCSLECTQTHRTRNSCSGIRDPTKFIPKRAMQASTIDMDYNFLKKVAKSKQDRQGEVKKLNPETSMTRTRKMEEARRKRFLAVAKRRGVEVLELPLWMERRKRNRTKLKRESKTLEWTVEWVVDVNGATQTITDDRFPEMTSLNDALQDHIAILNKEVHFLIRKADQPANSQIYTRLYGKNTLANNLKGLKISEFPTILVKDEIPPEWTIETDPEKTAINDTRE